MDNAEAKQVLTKALLIKYTGDYKSIDLNNVQVGATNPGSSSDSATAVSSGNNKGSSSKSSETS